MARDGGSQDSAEAIPADRDRPWRAVAGWAIPRWENGLRRCRTMTSISRHRLGRMELGQGGSIALSTTGSRPRQSLASTCSPPSGDAGPVSRVDPRSGGARRLAAEHRSMVATWCSIGHVERASDSTRPLLPAERAIVRVVSSRDLGAERDACCEATNASVIASASGTARGAGSLVVARSPDNQRASRSTSRDRVSTA